MDFQFSIVLDVTQFAEFIHEITHTRSGRADHLREDFLTKFSDDWLRRVFSSNSENCSSHIEGRAMYRFLQGTADQYMTRAVTAVAFAKQPCVSWRRLLEKHDFNSFPVVEEGKMLGIVSKFDFLRAFGFTTGQMVPQYDELMRRPVAEMMTEAVVHVEPAAPLTRVLQLMVSLKTRSFPVVSPDHELVGMISREDVMRALKEATEDD